jgi:serine/threonine protein kinase
MATDVDCPSRTDFERLKAGDPAERERIFIHVEGCPRCGETLVGMDRKDTFVDLVRRVAKTHGTTLPEEEQLIRQILSQKPLGHVHEAPTETRAVADPETDDDELYSVFDPPSAPGELGRFGAYRVIERLGFGGMGIVFRAEDQRLGRSVALKLMRPSVAKRPGAKDRFLREARAVAALENDHVVPIYEVNETKGVPYLCMPYLKGSTLADRLRQGNGTLPIHETITIGRQIATGLAAAHALGIVHRDIKPANLWLESGANGRVRILDFGLARNHDDLVLTQNGVVIGTPSYIAPEQARGECVDHRADLFSLGVVLYSMCTGNLPFRGNTTLAVLTSLAVDTPTPVRERNPLVFPALAEFIDRLLAKDRNDRHASTEDVVRDLHALEAAAVTSDVNDNFAPTPVTVDAAGSRKKSRTNGAIAFTAAAILFAGIGSGIYHFVFETKNGKLIVAVDDGIDLRFKTGVLEVFDAQGKRTYTLALSEKNAAIAPGKYQVKVVGADGLKLDTAEFEMTKSGRVVLRVTAEPSATPAVVGIPDAGSNSSFSAADAFPGKLVLRDTFENAATSLLPLVDGPTLTHTVRDHKYLMTNTAAKSGVVMFVGIGPGLATGAFACRARVENGDLFCTFGARNDRRVSRWQALTIAPAGTWSVSRLRHERENEKWVVKPRTVLMSGNALDPSLVAGKWVTMAVRWSETDYTVWLNETLATSGTINPDDRQGGDPSPIQLGLHVLRDGPAKIEVDYATLWDQAGLPANGLNPKVQIKQVRNP